MSGTARSELGVDSPAPVDAVKPSLRLKGFNYTGRFAYHLVTVTRERRPHLVGDVARKVVESITRSAVASGFELLAFTVMPDHVHLLVLGTEDGSNAVRFVQRFKQLSGYAYSRQFGARLWAARFYDHTLRLAEDVLPVARYVIENPVAAGLVAHADEWPFTGGALVTRPRHAESIQDEGAKAPSPRPDFDVFGAGRKARR